MYQIKEFLTEKIGLKLINMDRNNRMKSGFTLIEALITLLIITVLSSIAMQNYSKYLIKMYAKTVQSDLASAATAMMHYRNLNFSYKEARLGEEGVFRNYSPEGAYEKRRFDLLFSNGGTINNEAKTYVIIAKPVAKPVQGFGSYAIDQLGAHCWDPATDAGCIPSPTAKEWN